MAFRRKIDGGVLAEGEATGHAHRVPVEVEEGSVPVSLDDSDDSAFEFMKTRFFSTPDDKDIDVTHEEHGPITLKRSTKWSSGVVRQFDYLSQAILNVSD